MHPLTCIRTALPHRPTHAVYRPAPPDYAAPPQGGGNSYMAPPTRHEQRVSTTPHPAHHGHGGTPQPRVRHPGPGTSPYGSPQPGVAAATYHLHEQTQGQRTSQNVHNVPQSAPTVAVRGIASQADEYYALPGPPTIIVHKDGSETRLHASKGPPPSAPPIASVPPSYQHSYATPGPPHHSAHNPAAGSAMSAQSGSDVYPRGNPPPPASSSKHSPHQGDYMTPPIRASAHEAGYGPGGGTAIASSPQRVVGGRIVSRPAPAPPPPKSPPAAVPASSQGGVSVGVQPGRWSGGAPSVLANQVYVQPAPASSNRAGYGPTTGNSRVRYMAPSSLPQVSRSSAGPAAVYASPHAAGQYQHSVGAARVVVSGPVEDADG